MSELPSKQQILDWISENPKETGKREIARAFGIKGGPARIELKRMLRELAAEGHITKRRKTYSDPDKLPPVSVLVVNAPDGDGDLFAQPQDWPGEETPPKVLMVLKSSDPALAEGHRILARVAPVKGEAHQYEGRLIRRIGTNPARILGIYRKRSEGGRIVPIDKGSDKEWRVPAGANLEARDGELVEARQTGPKGRMGLPDARVTEVLGDPSAPKAVSLIAIYQHGIPDHFPDAAIAEADAATPVTEPGERLDLRDVPIVTIDPADARDHDDACAASPDPDPRNEGGHIVWVAIADVAHYVRPGSALDKEARKRGNSSYFPDRVVPMLPDRLSGDLCSLHEDVDRPAIAVRLTLNAAGEKIAHRFHRILMRSRASLNYVEVQAARDGEVNARCAPLMESVINPLYDAYEAARKARAARAPLELDLPERKVELDETGQVTSVAFRDRLDAHKLIEEFMILANVAAAEELVARRQPLLFRVHEEPSPEKLDMLRETADMAGLVLAKGQVLKTQHLNNLLKQAADTDFAEMINISTLRSMTQAYYSPSNLGHFGLALRNYAHFTSPIRRYADLIVHRALITAHGWGDDGLSAEEIEGLKQSAEHISSTERRSMEAERDTTDRYLASFLSDRVGAELTGRIAGLAKFGAFVKLDETGADGLLPMRALGREYFKLNRDGQAIVGEETGLAITMGARVVVRLSEAVPITGGLVFELVSIEGKKMKPGRRPAGRKGRTRSNAKRKSQRSRSRR